MKKLINVFKRIGLMFGTFCMTIYTKVMAVRIGPVYGVEEPDPEPKITLMQSILEIIKTFIIPIAFVIGLIIYLKKSSSNIRVKVAVGLLAFVIAVLYVLYFFLA